MSKAIFISDGHSYWFEERRVPSVGSIIKQFVPNFERDYWLAHKTFGLIHGEDYKEYKKKHFPRQMMPDGAQLYSYWFPKTELSEYLRVRSIFVDQWGWKNAKANYKGTAFHEFMEAKAYEDGFLRNPFTGVDVPIISNSQHEYDNSAPTENLADLEDGCYLELLIFDKEAWICGQADMVWIETIDGKRYVDMDDHKTNEKKPTKSAPDRLAGCLDHLWNSKHAKYSIQLSLYCKMLERAGFIIRNVQYTHYVGYDPLNYTHCPVDYLTEEADNMISHWK